MSVDLAKTLKVMGTLLMISGRNEEARKYLKEALLVFELQGSTKLHKETLGKLKQLGKNM